MYTGPNIEREGLVFGYDTGYGVADNNTATRFYPGEPTTNLADTDAKRSFGVHGGNSSTTSSAPEYGLGWKKLIVTNIAGSNYRLAQFPYLSQADGTSRTYSVEYDVTGLTGYSLFVDGTTGYGPTSISGRGRYSFTTGAVSGAKNLAIFIGKSGTHSNINHVIYYKEYQVEEKIHATPFVDGTRSSTQSPIDLKKSTNIDLSNVSFDSTGQPVFDGTDDEINIGTNLGLQNASFSLGSVIKWDGGSQDTFFGYQQSGGGIQKNIHWRVYSNGMLRFDFYGNSINSASGAILSNEWTHLYVTYDYPSDTCICYKNGEVIMQGSAGPFLGDDTISTGFIGSWGVGNEHFGGEIPVFKVYNQALTAEEVKQNFNAYKNRFNL